MVNTDVTNSVHEAAVTLATTQIPDTQERAAVVIDSEAACRNFQEGRISAIIQGFKSRKNLIGHLYRFDTEHESLEGNEAADTAERAIYTGLQPS